MRNIPGNPDLLSAYSDVKFEERPVRCDRPRRRCLQALITDEFYAGRICEPRPQQAALTVIITDDHGLTRGDALFGERHDEGAELGIRPVEAGLVKVAHLARGRQSSSQTRRMRAIKCSRPIRSAIRPTIGGGDRTITGTWDFARTRRGREEPGGP